MAKTAKEYIATNDFEGAKARYEKAPRNWKEHWWQTCAEIFEKSAEWAKKYILDPIKRTIEVLIEKPTRKRKSKYDESIIFDCPDFSEDWEQKCYLIRLLNNQGELVWSKVGTTTKTIAQRMRQHLRYYAKYGITKLIVDRVYNTGEVPAEGLESMFRAEYMKHNPQAFRKNDRFYQIRFDLADADRLATQFVEG